jgi:hypothetical protein
MGFQIEVRAENFETSGALVRYAVVQTSRAIRERGRMDVATVGSLGRIGKGAFNTRFKRVPNGYVIDGYLRPSFLKVFETGGTSVGRPLLWIPIPPLKVKVRKYGGKLIRPRGSRVLLRASDKRPLYVGVTSITNRQRLHLRQIAYEEASKFIDRYGAISGTGGGGVIQL